MFSTSLRQLTAYFYAGHKSMVVGGWAGGLNIFAFFEVKKTLLFFSVVIANHFIPVGVK